MSHQQPRSTTRTAKVVATLVLALALVPVAGGVASATTPFRGAFATLSGAAEVPGPGDPDGAGAVVVWFTADLTNVCLRVGGSGLAPVTGAHIHRGGPGVAGPVVVALSPGVRNRDCVPIDSAFVSELREHPESFYLNVHTTEFPAGAIRGQLEASEKVALHPAAAASSVASGGAVTPGLFAPLTGGAEVPGPGDGDAHGAVVVFPNQELTELCLRVGVTGLATVSGAHIHEAPAGQAGSVVVAFPTIVRNRACSAVDAALRDRILANPSGFYVNLHTTEVPAGAVRGQLIASQPLTPSS